MKGNFFFHKTFINSHYFWWIVLAAIVPLLVMVYLFIEVSKNALEKETMSTLSIVANNKVNSIEDFIQSSKRNVSLLAQNPVVIEATKNVENAFKTSTQTNGNYATVTKELLSYSKYFFEKTNSRYTDILLLSPSGQILFTLTQPNLIGKNYLNTSLNKTQLATVFTNVITLLETEVSDFERAGINNELQAYIAVPVLENQAPIGVLVLQMSNRSITKVVNNLEGLGQTGETLVGKMEGNKIIPAVPLRFASIAEFINQSDKMDSKMLAAFKDATEGGEGEGLLKDYHGEKVIGVWRYLPSLGWGMLIKINASEEFAPVIHLKRNLLALSFITFLIAIIIAYIISKRLKQAEDNSKILHQQLASVARQAGMSEVATSVLHNVGNVLNSLNVSTTVISDKMIHTRLTDLPKAGELLQTHQADLPKFITEDPKGKLLPTYLIALANSWKKDHEIILKELGNLKGFVEHIKTIVTMQQSLSGTSNLIEMISLNDLLENTIKIASIEKHNIQLVREYNATDMIEVDKTKLMQVLINLLNNAKDSIIHSGRSDKTLTIKTKNLDDERLQILVIDNGCGIAEDIRGRIFTYGFTTKKVGHGFGLHSSALAAKKMGGSLTAYSAGKNMGAIFTLEIVIKII